MANRRQPHRACSGTPRCVADLGRQGGMGAAAEYRYLSHVPRLGRPAWSAQPGGPGPAGQAARQLPGRPAAASGPGSAIAAAAAPGQRGQCHGRRDRPARAGRRRLARPRRAAGTPARPAAASTAPTTLPVRGGGVVAALAGDDQVGPGQRRVQAGDPGDLGRAAAQLARPRRRPGRSRCRRPRRRRAARARRRARRPAGPGPPPAPIDLTGGGALLRAEHRRGAVAGRAAGRARRSGRPRRPAAGGRSPVRSALASPASAPPPRGSSPPAASQEARPRARPAPRSRRRWTPSRPGPITIRRAPGVQRAADQLADARGVRAERVGRGQQRQPGRAGQLDDVHAGRAAPASAR